MAEVVVHTAESNQRYPGDWGVGLAADLELVAAGQTPEVRRRQTGRARPGSHAQKTAAWHHSNAGIDGCGWTGAALTGNTLKQKRPLSLCRLAVCMF